MSSYLAGEKRDGQAPPERWHLITCEYPPQAGGVSDHTHLLADALATADVEVHVWSPTSQGESGSIVVHGDLRKFSVSDLARASRRLNEFEAPRRLFVQWVPHGYGYRSMNLAFCLWLWRRSAVHGDTIDLMVHEAFVAFGEGSWKQQIAAAAHRVMAVVLLRAAKRVWVSIPAWETALRPYALRRRIAFRCLPVFSNIPICDDAAGVHSLRSELTCGAGGLAGHFGTYGEMVTGQLRQILPLILSSTGVTVLLMGRESDEFQRRFSAMWPGYASRVRATGALSTDDLSRHISACDVMLQPYPDGISGRRGSALAALSHGKALVSTIGRLSEDFWLDSGSVELAAADDPAGFAAAVRRLLRDTEARARLECAAKALYEERFSPERVVEALRERAVPVEACL